ncbi:thermonuclease family protein [Paracoccus ravus]|uniref:thermonuclease family protein n=1 Tax=Paracoccus ravus TaxID=2447760 RepID=UPI001FD66C70|nr:thermonuclease family protein [Paracoccus ravus]
MFRISCLACLLCGSTALADQAIQPVAFSGENGARISGKARIVDGDTFKLGSATIRVHGIDAPEKGQSCAGTTGQTWACGRAATDFLAGLIKARTVTCAPIEEDRYGRIVARCFAGGRDLGREMVTRGLAWAFIRYSRDYLEAESLARSQRLGIWQADTQPASDYRAGGWAEAVDTAPAKDCPIKGNISAKGERIYHMPWSPAYAKTRIDASKGERWFCDEREAVAAGWRAAR